MTHYRKSYRLRIANAGAATVEGSVALTITSTHLAGVPVIPGPTPRILSGRSEGQSWSVTMRGSAILGTLGDAAGNPQYGGRLCDWSEATNGGAHQVVWTGRLTYLEFPAPSTARATFDDERWLERNITAFKNHAVTRLLPAGPPVKWRGNKAGSGTARVVEVWNPNPSLWLTCLRLTDTGRAPQRLIDYILANRAKLRLNVGSGATALGTSFSITAWGRDRPPTPWEESLEDVDMRGDWHPHVWISHSEDPLWTVGTLTLGYLTTTSEPASETPGYIASAEPFQIVKDLYDEHGIRYDAAAMSDLIARPFPKMSFRVEKPEQLARWLEREIYGPLNVIPLINAAGDIVPTDFGPAVLTQAEYDALFSFGASNLTEDGHPTFRHNPSDARNAALFTYQEYTIVSRRERGADANYALDGFRVTDAEPIEHTHDPTLGALGRREQTYSVDGMEQGGAFRWEGRSIHTRDTWADERAAQLFATHGHGPITGEMKGRLGTADSVIEGQLVRIDLDTFPNPAINDLGGSRIVRILRRIRHPSHIDYEFLDVGAAAQPLAAPTVAAAKNTGDPLHSLDVTVSNMPAGADEVAVEIATDSTFTEVVRRYRFVGNATRTFNEQASGQTYYVRGISRAAGRISVGWSSTASAILDSIAAPTLLAVSNIDSETADLSWTVGDSDYPHEILLVKGLSPASWSDDDLVERVSTQTVEHTLQDLEPGTEYTVGVRHVDEYGGESGVVEATFTTLSAPTRTSPDVAGFAILFGGA